jgi:hypothetical protein
MWAVRNRTSYKVGRIWGRDKDGVHEWIVAVKGTFDIKPDESLTLADEHVEPLLLPEYNGEPGVSSLRYDADLVAAKPTTDVVVNGTAYAPKGRPSTDFSVSLRVGRVHKVIRVVGNRRWKRGLFGLKPSAAEPITELPINYERAYGGYDQTDPDPKMQRIDSRNPVGCGVVARSKNRLGKALPNFEYSRGKLEKAGPAGFGALDSHWSPRRELAGTYDEAWRQNRFPLLPADWDQRCLLCSPADQRAERYLRGGELVELENMTKDGKLRFALPRTYLRFQTRIDNRTEEHEGRLATVIIEPDYPRVIMVWQSSLAVRTNGDYLDETIVSEKVRLR